MMRLLAAVWAKPVARAVALGVVSAGIGWLLRYQAVEPAVFGAMCRADVPPGWCPLRTGLIVAIELGGPGVAALALAVAALAVKGRAARLLCALAMVAGGAGLILYNASLAAAGVLVALLRATRLGRPAS